MGGYSAQFTLDGNLDFPLSGAWEIGPVRYKLRLGGRFEASYQIGDIPFSQAPNDVAVQAKQNVEAQWRPNCALQLKNTVEANLGGEFGQGRMGELFEAAEVGNPRKFGQLILQSLNLGMKFQLPGNRYLDSVAVAASLDADFCFFSATLERSQLLYSSPGEEGGHRFQVRLPASISFYFGPSRALWLNLVSRLGPAGFRTFVGELLPAAGAEGAAASGFLGWLGPMAMAVPLALTVRDLSELICRVAYQEGLQRGRLAYFGVCYARTVYGLAPSRHLGEGRTREDAIRTAREHCARYGQDQLRRLLERIYWQGRSCVRLDRSIRDRDVDSLGFQLGESLHSGAPQQVWDRY